MVDTRQLLDIQRAAEEMLAPLVRARSEDIARALSPRPEDYARVFVPTAVATAQSGFAQLWSTPPKSFGKPHQTEVKAFAADAASLRDDNDYSKQFPGGYRRIASLLQPGIVWVRFKVFAPGEPDGIAHDGLVKLDDHWAWFPKPWRVLANEDSN